MNAEVDRLRNRRAELTKSCKICVNREISENREPCAKCFNYEYFCKTSTVAICPYCAQQIKAAGEVPEGAK